MAMNDLVLNACMININYDQSFKHCSEQEQQKL